MGGNGRSYDPGEASHRALHSIRQELNRHPAVTEARGFPTGSFTEVVADVAVERWEIQRDGGTLTVRWFAGDTSQSDPKFSFHYSDEETDFGWHHEPNPHVDGWGHFQKRGETSEDIYSYESFDFQSKSPPRVAWEIMSRISMRLGSE